MVIYSGAKCKSNEVIDTQTSYQAHHMLIQATLDISLTCHFTLANTVFRTCIDMT